MISKGKLAVAVDAFAFAGLAVKVLAFGAGQLLLASTGTEREWLPGMGSFASLSTCALALTGRRIVSMDKIVLTVEAVRSVLLDNKAQIMTERTLASRRNPNPKLPTASPKPKPIESPALPSANGLHNRRFPIN